MYVCKLKKKNKMKYVSVSRTNTFPQNPIVYMLIYVCMKVWVSKCLQPLHLKLYKYFNYKLTFSLQFDINRREKEGLKLKSYFFRIPYCCFCWCYNFYEFSLVLVNCCWCCIYIFVDIFMYIVFLYLVYYNSFRRSRYLLLLLC